MATQSDQRILPMLGSQLLRLYRDPMHIIGGAMDAASLWSGSRRWRRIFFTLPFWLAMVLMLFFATAIRLQNGDAFERKYARKGEDTISLKELEEEANQQLERGSLAGLDGKAKSDRPPTESSVEIPAGEGSGIGDSIAASISDSRKSTKLDLIKLLRVEMLANRILQNHHDNILASYRHALSLALQGRLEDAEKEFSALAPDNEVRHRPAHAWIALRLLRRNHDGESIEGSRLNHHLTAAKDWPDIPLSLLEGMSDILLQSNRGEEAYNLDLLAVKRDKAMSLHLAKVAQILGKEDKLQEAADAADAYYRKRLGTDDETEKDRINVAESRSLLGQIDEAIKILKDGILLTSNPTIDKPQLSRALSHAYLIKYSKSVQKVDGQWKADLSILSEAAKADPKYNKVGESIASLLLLDIEAPTELTKYLRDQMKLGIASTGTYEFIGQRLLVGGDWKNSAIQWEAVIKKSDNAATVTKAYNNLAMCQIHMIPPENEKALENIQKAIGIAKNPNAELIDSYGEVLLANGNLIDGISVLQQCLFMDPNRLNTRRKLIKALDKAGMSDTARTHEKIYEKIEAALADAERTQKKDSNNLPNLPK